MFKWSQGPATWLFVTDPDKWVAMEAEGIRTRDGMVLKSGGSEPLVKFTLCHTNQLSFEDLGRCCEHLKLPSGNSHTKRLEALADYFCPGYEVFRNLVLQCYSNARGKKKKKKEVSLLTETVLDNLDPDDRSAFKDIDEELKKTDTQKTPQIICLGPQLAKEKKTHGKAEGDCRASRFTSNVLVAIGSRGTRSRLLQFDGAGYGSRLL